MISKWFNLKDDAVAMRKSGMSMTVIERKLGIPRSTLSGWFKSVPLTEDQRVRLMKNSHDGWQLARARAVESHRAQKALRLLEARKAAEATLDELTINDETLDLALAMLYFGEGAKSSLTSLGSSNPSILKLVLYVLKRNYRLENNQIHCDLHLRMDQNASEVKTYWAQTLNLPLSCFRSVVYDKRTEGRPTYPNYKGVCVLACGNIAIQRKLVYLYSLFCEKITELEAGA